MRPRILVNCSLNDDEAATRTLVAYCDPVHDAGGLPLVAPVFTDEATIAEALAVAQGVLFIGGPDYHPDAYGETQHPQAYLMDRRRHEADLALARAALQRQLPVLGICGGHQLLAIASGGALIQDIPSQWRDPLPHRGPHANHPIDIREGSRLARLIGRKLMVNSFHHQAVRPDRCGAFVVAAQAPDGIVEAIEHPALPFAIGVQWHPERMPESAASRALFQAFVEAARLHSA
ncbi:MAG: gamma-glutamyl-gamma-aminobutyrate hydrolase family protein [Planctomycetota bacterium]|nr:gamma-glutamyl-gamma-aminobutyrate hydrolase family protein [Planctomycetota bacterium]